MQIDIIETREAFEEIRAQWETVYDADPEAQFFLSFDFMSGWIPILESPWLILAARPASGADYVAFFPLRIRTRHVAGKGFHNELNMAGNYAADYTGFICLPEQAGAAITAFARHLRRMNWTTIHIENIRCSPGRLALFTSSFPMRTFSVAQMNRTNKLDGVNNLICPAIELPATWEDYLQKSLSANVRQRLRRLTRQVEGDAQFRITHTDEASLDQHINALLDLWARRWGARKGQRLQNILASNRAVMRFSQAQGSLFLPVLWYGDRPLCALAFFADPRKKVMHFYIGGRDDEFEGAPAGHILHAHSIRHAIENGFGTYDFLRGDESYKFWFGAREQRIDCRTVTTRNGRNTGGKLDTRTLKEVFDMSSALYRKGRVEDAAIGYRQILAVDPDDFGALYCLGQLEAARGQHGEAVKQYRHLATLKPGVGKVWARLARSLETLGFHVEALQARSHLAACEGTTRPKRMPLSPVMLNNPAKPPPFLM